MCLEREHDQPVQHMHECSARGAGAGYGHRPPNPNNGASARGGLEKKTGLFSSSPFNSPSSIVLLFWHVLALTALH